jgi:hypothetical protein
MTCVSVIDQYGGSIGRYKGAVEDQIITAGYMVPASAGGKPAAPYKAKNKFPEMAFISSLDKFRYGKILEYLEKDLAKFSENYQECVTNAYNMVVICKNQQQAVGRLLNDLEAMTFANEDGIKESGTTTINCFNFQAIGNYANDCPANTNIGGKMSMLLMEEDESGGRGDTDYDITGEFSFRQGGTKYVNS